MVAQNTTRDIRIRVSAQDDATPVLQRVASTSQNIARSMDTRKIFGPAVKPRFDTNEQEIRSEMAARLRIMRDAARSANIDEEVNKRLFGEKAPEKAALSESDFGRAEISRRSKVLIGEREMDVARALRKQAEGIELTSKLIRGVGALGAFSELGRAMQELPKAIEEFHERVRWGMSRTEAFGMALADAIPGAGELAKGFRTLFDELSGINEDLRARQFYHDQQHEQYETTENIRQKRDKARDEIMSKSRDASISAADDMRLSGRTGIMRERVAAQLEYEKSMREIAADQGKRGSLSPDEAAKFDAQQSQRKQAAFFKLRDANRDIDKRAMDADLEAQREHDDRLTQMQNESRQRDLKQLGYYNTARLAEINSAADAEHEAERRRYQDAIQNLPGGMLRDAEEQRHNGAVAAIEKKRKEDLDEARAQQRRDQYDADRDRDRQIESTRASAIATRLRAGRQSAAAEQMERAEAHRQRMDELKKQEQEEIQHHAENADRIRAQYRELYGAENDSYAASEKAAAMERSRQYLPDFTAHLTESNAVSGAMNAGAVQARASYQQKQADLLKEVVKSNQENGKVLNDLLATIKSGGGIVILRPS